MEPTEEAGDRAQGPEQVPGAGSDSEARSRGAVHCGRQVSLHWAGGDTSSAGARTVERGAFGEMLGPFEGMLGCLKDTGVFERMPGHMGRHCGSSLCHPADLKQHVQRALYRRPKTPDRREGCARRWQGGPLESSSSAPTELIVPGWRFCISGTWSQNCTCSKSGWWLALPRIVPV